ncbi:MAG: hypothetical protein LWX51_08255 [Deltaproteobacteria bacterium]|jgi:hypothetical protein|nr:hypothetical protein [Deltaproteobacteria bacterium]
MNQGSKYCFVSDNMKHFTWRERILLFTVQRDLARGRNGDVSGWYGDLKESIYMFSSGYVHLADEIFINTIYWNELREYGKPDQYGDGGIDLPPGHAGFACATSGKRRSFNLTARKLVREKILWGFTISFRSIQGLGGKSTPLLQVWSDANRDKPKDIFAVSLTKNGFNHAKEILRKKIQISPWQLHETIVKSKEFASKITGNELD